MLGFLKQLRDRFAMAKVDNRVCEADILAAGLEARDKADPSWDDDARIAGCENGIRIGLSERVLKRVYGEEILAVAIANCKKANET